MSQTTNVKRRKGSQHDKSGCLTCRYRRKKCVQNTFPVCGTCARLHLECIRESPRNVVPPQFAAGEQALAAIAPLPPSSSSCSSSPLPQSLDQPLPVCSIQTSSPTRDMHIGPASQSLLSGASNEQHRHAMRYYVNELANHFSVSPQFNSFLSDFLPMAMHSRALQGSLLALASSHISMSEPAYAVASIEAQAMAILHLKSAIALPQRDVTWSLENAATCLVLAMGLITTNDSQGWYSHMQGAKHLIFGAQGSSSDGKPLLGIDCLKQTAEGRWVLRNFAYHDVLGCVTLHSRPLIDPGYISSICNDVDSYMGVGTSLLQHIAEIQILDTEDSQQAHKMQGSPFSAEFEERWTRLEKDLQDWVCPMSTIYEDLRYIALAYRSVALILLYRLVRKQARVFLGTGQHEQEEAHTHEEDELDTGSLFSTETLVELLDSKISFEVSETIRYISAIPVWSAPEAAVLFPLFVAGGEARNDQQTQAVRVRLGQNLARRKFQNISRAMEILEAVWEKRKSLREETHQDSDSGQVDWADELKKRGWELVLT